MSGKRPLVVGLTGSIGMGKTETARMFVRLGIPVHDADAAVHRLYETNAPAISAVGTLFPDCLRDGRIDRACLSQRVKGDQAALATLEAIIHPLVAADQREFIEAAGRRGSGIVVLDIPLLFETGGDERMDAVVVVSAPPEVQRERVLARPGMSEEMLGRILARQLPDVDKRARAHFVVETGEGFDHAFAQVKSIVAALRLRSMGEKAPPDQTKKRPYLVVYDYGQGGVWAIIMARFKHEIETKYPAVKIFEDRPPFLDEPTYTKIASAMTIDIDDTPTGWLAGL